MAALPDCECIYGLPLNDKLDAIYCYLYQHATSTVSLPSCDCIRGYELQDKVSAIYCALLQLSTGGGSITLSQISDMSAFWKNANAQTPAASTYLTSNGAGVFAAVPFANISVTSAQISDATAAGRLIMQASDASGGNPGAISWVGGVNNPPAVQDTANFLQTLTGNISPNPSGTTSPVTSISMSNGIITAIS